MLSGRPWKTIDCLAVLAFLSALAMGGVLARLSALQAEATSTPEVGTAHYLAAMCSYGLMIALVHIMVRARGATWTSAFGFRSSPGGATLRLAFGAAFLTFPIARMLGALSAEVMQDHDLTPVMQESVRFLRETTEVGPQIALVLIAIVVAPATEELLFRGILYPYVKQRGHPNLALWGTSVLFGAVHFNLAVVVPLTFLAVVMVWLYETTDNLTAPIVAHSVFNLVNYLGITVERWESNWALIDLTSLLAGIVLIRTVLRSRRKAGGG